MKATIDIDDTLYRRLKIEAARRGRTVRELVAEGVQQVLGWAGSGFGHHDTERRTSSVAARLAWFARSLRRRSDRPFHAFHPRERCSVEQERTLKMSAGLDTSVALRLLTGKPQDQAEIARVFVASEKRPVAVSDLVISETYYALRHHYEVPHAQAVHALSSLLSDSRLHSSGNARRVLAELSSRPGRNSPGLVDRLIQADYARDEIALVTFDRELAKIAGVKFLK